MRSRYAFGALLALAFIALLASPGQAARPEARQGSLQGSIKKVVVGSRQQAVSATCALGVLGPASFPMQYLYPPDDQYFTLLDPAQCACLDPDGALVTAAHVVLDFAEACAIPVRIGIVAADLSDSQCPAPVVEQYLCPPTDFELTVNEAGEYDFALPLEASCHLTQKAFLMVTFVTGGDCGSWPGLMIDTAVCGCVSYNAWPGSGPPSDLCGALPGSPVMYVETTCGGAVPAARRTWGSIKSVPR